MKSATVNLPEKLQLADVLSFSRTLDDYAKHDRLVVDFGHEKFLAPFTMLVLASKLKYIGIKQPDLKLDFKNYEGFGYPAHMGFFQMFELEYGRRPGEAFGNENYLPITCVERSSLYESPGDKYEELPDLIQRHADRIALVIARNREENPVMFDVLSYSIREVMRNVFEHSECDALYYCAQFWPKSNKVEFAISDFGIGIRQGLGTNPNFRFATDKEAIEYSLLPSVSGKTHLERTSGTWFNSGYGLYMTNRLARNGGNFVLASGNAAIHLSRKTKNNYQTSFPGTVLRFNIDVKQIGDVKERLDQFRKEGFELAKKIKGSGNRPPSAMSLLLRRDFK